MVLAVHQELQVLTVVQGLAEQMVQVVLQELVEVQELVVQMEHQGLTGLQEHLP
jgi:hypothetical protein